MKCWWLIGLVATAAGAQTPLRREAGPGFAIDEGFQADGGVQYFYALLRDEPSPATVTLFQTFKPFDAPGVFDALAAPPNVVLSRLVYTVEKDLSFFSEARVRDVAYINAVAVGMEVSKRADGSFHVGAMPANDFTIEYLDAAALQAGALRRDAVRRALELTPGPPPDLVVFQHNRDFARVLGMRTADGAFTWTLHFALAPGRTRLVVFTLSYLRSMPPFFLGGERRIFKESTEGARTLIDRLRAFQP